MYNTMKDGEKMKEKNEKKKPTVYLSNKELLAETLKSKQQEGMTPRLAEMLMLLTQRYARRGNFAGYSYNLDMQGAALVMLVKNWGAFNPAISENPFAFYTQIIKNAFIQQLNIERKHRDIRDELLIKEGMQPSFTYQNDYEGSRNEDRQIPIIENEELI